MKRKYASIGDITLSDRQEFLKRLSIKIGYPNTYDERGQYYEHYWSMSERQLHGYIDAVFNDMAREEIDE